jgi:hypothetical protein
MTTKELHSTIASLSETVRALAEENRKFKCDVLDALQTTTKRIDAKHEPIYLERDILAATQKALSKVIGETLAGYNSPLVKLTNAVVNEHLDELAAMVRESFASVIRADEFKAAIRDGFYHKVARTIVSNHAGMLDKAANDLKQDGVFKARLVAAVANVIEELAIEKAKGSQEQFLEPLQD